MNIGKGFLRILLLSIVVNIGLFLVLLYILCVKTDLCYRAFSKMGIIEYNIANNRHLIEKRCLEGWANCIGKQKIMADVAFYGNSITYESDFQTFFPQINIINLGCNRDDLDDLIHRSFLISSVHPRKLFIMGGINSILDVSLDTFEKKYKILVDTIIIQNPGVKLYMQSILPTNYELEIGSRYKGFHDKIKEANRIINMISLDKGCQYVDLYSAYQINDTMPREYTRDGLHLYPEAYSIWAKTIYPYLAD